MFKLEWWLTPVITALGRWKQMDQGSSSAVYSTAFKASLRYVGGSFYKTNRSCLLGKRCGTKKREGDGTYLSGLRVFSLWFSMFFFHSWMLFYLLWKDHSFCHSICFLSSGIFILMCFYFFWWFLSNGRRGLFVHIPVGVDSNLIEKCLE